jgi:rhodanese-related sulfurtransferase
MMALLAAAAFAGEPIVVPLMSQETLLQRQARNDAALFVLDVRTPEEFAAGHVPGAVNVPHDQLANRLAEVPRDKDVVVYCRSGRRSQIAADILATNGFERISHLEGDMIAWQEKARPIAKP